MQLAELSHIDVLNVWKKSRIVPIISNTFGFDIKKKWFFDVTFREMSRYQFAVSRKFKSFPTFISAQFKASQMLN